jgi:pentatricopeptide repeat protein
MQQAGAQPDAITFTCLIEGCVLSKEPDMALKWFRKAVAMGICKSLHVSPLAVPLRV